MHGAQVSLNPYEFLRGRSMIGSLFGGVKPKSDIPVFAKKYLDNVCRHYFTYLLCTQCWHSFMVYINYQAITYYSWGCSWFWIYCVLLVMFVCAAGASFGRVHIAWIELPRHKQSLRIASRRKEPPLHYMDGSLDWTAAYVVPCC